MKDMAAELKRARKRAKTLRNDRSSWDSHYRDIRDFILPRGARFPGEEANKSDRTEWSNIIDTHGTRAGRVLSAGLMAGMTSPARPWFRLATNDPDLMEYAPVKVWLDKLTRDMRNIFARSNAYRALHGMYLQLGHFGTAVSTFDDDFDDVIHLQNLLIGQYAIATDARNRVSSLYREFQMTVEQMVMQFGKEKCSNTVQRLYDAGEYDKWIDVTHALEPRRDRDPGLVDNGNMAFASLYFETNGNSSQYLHESGMKRFRAIAARWDVAGMDAYGTGPGSEALGHIKQLQQEQLSKAKGIAFQADPPLQMPSSVKSDEVEAFPGGRTFVDSPVGIRSLFDVRLDLNHLLADIQDVRKAIDASYYVDLFLMLANDTRSNITAREVAERHEEKLLMLGPVLERLHNEMLDPLIELTFERMQNARGSDGRPMMPEAPKELRDVMINVEFVSTLAQAQRAVGIGAVDRWLGVVGAVAQMKPGILDKVDEDQIADVSADMLGVDATLVVPDDKVAETRSARAQREQMAQAAAMAKPAADAAQAASTVAQMPQESKQTITDILASYQGYSSPTGA